MLVAGDVLVIYQKVTMRFDTSVWDESGLSPCFASVPVVFAAIVVPPCIF